jgi:hypothetical protein
MNFDFYGIKEVIEEFNIPETEYVNLAKLLDEYDADYFDQEDYLKDSTNYIVFDAYNFNDIQRIFRWGKDKCLDILNRGYSETFRHYIDDETLEKEIKEDFYEFTFVNSYNSEETIFIYPLNY